MTTLFFSPSITRQSTIRLFCILLLYGISSTSLFATSSLPSGLHLAGLYKSALLPPEALILVWEVDEKQYYGSTFSYSFTLENASENAHKASERTLPSGSSIADTVYFIHPEYLHEIQVLGNVITKVNQSNRVPFIWEDFRSSYPRVSAWKWESSQDKYTLEEDGIYTVGKQLFRVYGARYETHQEYICSGINGALVRDIRGVPHQESRGFYTVLPEVKRKKEKAYLYAIDVRSWEEVKDAQPLPLALPITSKVIRERRKPARIVPVFQESRGWFSSVLDPKSKVDYHKWSPFHPIASYIRMPYREVICSQETLDQREKAGDYISGLDIFIDRYTTKAGTDSLWATRYIVVTDQQKIMPEVEGVSDLENIMISSSDDANTKRTKLKETASDIGFEWETDAYSFQVSALQNAMKIRFYNSQGKLLKTAEIPAGSSRVDLSELSPGVIWAECSLESVSEKTVVSWLHQPY